MKLHFVDISPGFLDEIAVELPDSTRTLGDVADLPRRRSAFVSPANSLGFMDGGIDLAYSRRMFPGVEREVKRRIALLGKKTSLGRHYLPIGSAITVPVVPSTCTYLVSCPTMFLPHDVSGTRNAYHAFMAALMAASKLRDVDTLVCCALCCGYGKMSAQESARQIAQAYRDFSRGRAPADAAPHDRLLFLGPDVTDSQPDNFDNREIKEIVLSRS